jgi:F420H(2)-dependent quinone reductase
MPPRWFIHSVWVGHRALHRFTGGRLGLWLPKDGKWGTLRLTTIGRRSGQVRNAIIGYLEDGENLVTLAMNGWGGPEPAWWLNLLAHSDATVELADGPRPVHARAAVGAERDRLWGRFRNQQAWGGTAIDAFAQRRPRETAVVVFEPRR